MIKASKIIIFQFINYFSQKFSYTVFIAHNPIAAFVWGDSKVSAKIAPTNVVAANSVPKIAKSSTAEIMFVVFFHFKGVWVILWLSSSNGSIFYISTSVQ